MSYNNNIIMTLGVDDESTYGKKLAITVAVDTLDRCTISFGNSFSIRIPEDDVDALRGVLHDASRKLMVQRVDREYNVIYGDEASEEMAAEAEAYDPEDDWALAEEEAEQLRRDEKNGLYPDRWDDSN